MATMSLIESACLSLPAATLIKIEGADHSFKAGKQNIEAMLACHRGMDRGCDKKFIGAIKR